MLLPENLFAIASKEEISITEIYKFTNCIRQVVLGKMDVSMQNDKRTVELKSNQL